MLTYSHCHQACHQWILCLITSSLQLLSPARHVLPSPATTPHACCCSQACSCWCMLTCGAVPILLHPSVAEVILPPPALEPVGLIVHAPGLALQAQQHYLSAQGSVEQKGPSQGLCWHSSLRKRSTMRITADSNDSREVRAPRHPRACALCSRPTSTLALCKLGLASNISAHRLVALAIFEILLPLLSPLLGLAFSQQALSPLQPGTCAKGSEHIYPGTLMCSPLHSSI